MQLVVNGVKREHPQGVTIRGIVQETGAHPERVAVVLNGEVVPRDQWDRVSPGEGDDVEILTFAGGGRS